MVVLWGGAVSAPVGWSQSAAAWGLIRVRLLSVGLVAAIRQRPWGLIWGEGLVLMAAFCERANEEVVLYGDPQKIKILCPSFFCLDFSPLFFRFSSPYF